MKKRVYLSVVLLFVFNTFTVFPQQDEPIIISPLIGEELDRVERDYFHLFPKIDGFEKAVFDLNDDNSLKVNITTFNNNITKDSIIEKYSSIRDMEKHITTRIYMDLRDEAGPNFTVRTGFSRLTEQKMVALNEQSLFTIDKVNIDQEYKEPSLSSIWETNLNDIHSVIRERESNVWSYAQTGALIGSGAGLLIGFLAGKGNKSENEFLSSEAVGILGGVLIGAGIGLVIGAIIGISSTEEEVIIYPHTPEGISTLQSYSLFNRKDSEKNE
jgi:hypothetical protein